MALPLAFFSATWRGIPLIYSGQELPNHKRLAFFDKDCLDWKPKPDLHEFYKTILELRKSNPAFSASPHPENCILLNNSVDHHVLSFMRKNGDSTAVVVINFSQYTLTHVEVGINDTNGLFTALFTNVTKDFGDARIYVDLPPWSFQGWIK
jgi:glycosidase